MSLSHSTSRTFAALLGAGAVVIWRILALRQPSGLLARTPGFALPLSLIGIGFVVVGAIVFLRRPGPAAGPYLAWCLGSGVHWGGAVGADSASVELSMLLLYIGLSIVGAAALFHLAWCYPPQWNAPRWTAPLLYLPGAVGVLVAPFAAALPVELLRAVAGALLLLGNALGLGAGVIFIVRWLRADRSTRQRGRLGLVVASLLIAGVPSLLASSGVLPGPTDAYNLLSLIAPVGLGHALWRLPA